ncbi:FAD-binding oxidoreductase [Nonomuraea sp. NPDC050556]|uniref:FAD-binding oxidoreductase n=1 Tax=Nonomuraea sp. NPDC050556 TaxID=3364369 RepID=UPI0037AEBCCE
MRITRDQHGYDEERSGFQTLKPHSPDVIFAVETASEIQEAVRHGPKVAVQATGHGLWKPLDGGVLISTRRMTAVRINEEEQTATLQAGAQWAHVIEAAAPYGLAPLSGSSPHVGAVGYTLGGGIGLLSRQYGYAADLVRAMDVVTADGERVRLTPGDELFHAMLGTRGALGVVTEMEIGLLPVTTVYGGGLQFPASREVVEGYLEWTRTLPDEVTSALALMTFPDGRHLAHIRLASTAKNAADLAEPLRSLGTPLTDTLRTLPFTESGAIANDPPHPHAYTGTSTYLDSVDARELLEASTHLVVQLRHLGGRMTEPSRNLVAHRDAQYLLNVVSPAAEPLEGLKGRGPFLNLVYGEPTADELRRAFTDYDEVTQLKNTYDPQNRLTGDVTASTTTARMP